jgi:hypothetical protein
MELASRLGATHQSVERALAEAPLGDLLHSARYAGILHDFAGTRWWRAGIEDVLWQITEGQSYDPDAVHGALIQLAPGLERLGVSDPVVCISANLNAREFIAPAKECVRVQPDDWPPFADTAWAHLNQVRDSPRIAALVIEEDTPILAALFAED